MPSRPLDPVTMLGGRLSATISRNRYTTDPQALLDELIEVAGDRTDVLAQEAGIWAGFHETNEYTRALVAALKTLPGVDAWVQVGRERAAAGSHSNPT